jgi:hypothetical protein
MSTQLLSALVLLLVSTTVCLVSSKASTQGFPSSDSDAKSVEQLNKPLPIRLPANSGLPSTAFKAKESFMKGIPANAIMTKFEMTPYKGYVQKYAPAGTVGMSDVSPDRMVAVVVVDFPKGFVGQYNEFSNARLTTAYDAVTGQVISYELLGTPIRSFGPSFIPSPNP